MFVVFEFSLSIGSLWLAVPRSLETGQQEGVPGFLSAAVSQLALCLAGLQALEQRGAALKKCAHPRDFL